MENRLFTLVRRLIARQDDVDDALVVDAMRIPEFLLLRVTPDMRREAIKRVDDLKRNPRQASAECLDHTPNNAICYLTADGSVFGPIGSSFRVRTRKFGPSGRANDDLANADEVG